MFIWTEEMVRFLHDAAEYGGYHPAFADKVAQVLGPRDHVCDAGCGLGYLARELAKRYPQVTAADISPLAAAHARALAADAENMTVLETDLFGQSEGPVFDAMTFCFFGSIRQILQVGKTRCRGTLAAVMKDYSAHRFSIGQQPLRGSTATRSGAWLTEHGIPFRREELTLEMGQPFRDLSEAVRFFQIYSRDPDREAITEEAVAARLTHITHPVFSWYLPGERKMGVLRIETKDIPREVLD